MSDVMEPYYLAVDIGTSRVAAATARLAHDGGIATAVFPLGRRSDSAPTVVFVGEDGELLFGDAAERRGIAQPDRLVREFKRSVGDEVPISVAGRAIPAEQLYARTVVDVIDAVTAREGAEPAGIVLTHPASWGLHRLGLVRSAAHACGIDDVTFLPEPEAAAREYEASHALDDDETLAVYDLGGGTFDCVLLRRTGGSFVVVGAPIGLDDLGGADFDDAVLRHVLRRAEVAPAALADASGDARMALAQLRRECVDAKEALSFDSDVVVPVLLPAARSSIRLTRTELEEMIEAPLARTLDAVDDALDEAGRSAEQLTSILLIGGSSRIPLVAERLSERFDLPIAIDADPKASIATGAARTALVRAMGARMDAAGTASADDTAAPAPGGEHSVVLAAPVGPVAAASGPGIRYTIVLSAAAVLLAGAIVFGSTLTAGNGSTFVPVAEQGRTPTPSPTPVPAGSAPTAPTSPSTAPVDGSAPVTEPRTDTGQRTTPGAQTPRRSTPRAASPGLGTAPGGSTGGSTGGSAGGAAGTTPQGTTSTEGGSTPQPQTSPSAASSEQPSSIEPEPQPEPTPTPIDPVIADPAPDPGPTQDPPPDPSPTPLEPLIS
jgi:molecular chaperone DnaK